VTSTTSSVSTPVSKKAKKDPLANIAEAQKADHALHLRQADQRHEENMVALRIKEKAEESKMQLRMARLELKKQKYSLLLHQQNQAQLLYHGGFHGPIAGSSSLLPTQGVPNITHHTAAHDSDPQSHVC
jgi:hypothetical protein